jgi:hypothetical protein
MKERKSMTLREYLTSIRDSLTSIEHGADLDYEVDGDLQDGLSEIDDMAEQLAIVFGSIED